MTADEARQALIARLAEIEEQEQIGEEDRKPVTLQQDSVGRLSRMDAMQVQAMALATAQRRRAEKLRIEAAMGRLDEGEWGWCVGCGEEIAEQRLAHDPSVARCIKCAGSDGG